MAEKHLTFFEHLEELRTRLVVAIIAVLVTASVAYFFSFEILELLKRPAGPITLNYLNVLEPFMARFKVSVFAGVIVSSPIIFYEILAFLSPALRKKEKKYLYPAVAMIVLFFALGVLVGYLYIVPMSITWLMSQAGTAMNPLLSVNEYIKVITLFLLAFGVGFETPVVVLVLVKLRIVPYETLVKNWRVAFIVILVVAAIATPDWSLPPMLILGGSMLVLFGLTLLVARFMK
ncbi:MAG: twin-arginine translocase subunit TatC [Actinobacteria bacterium]|nr:MAG: twin-arginine translocase subunit TatC [Actinomycetota bacterium]